MKPGLSGNLPASVTSSRGVIECEKKKKHTAHSERRLLIQLRGRVLRPKLDLRGGCERCVEGRGRGEDLYGSEQEYIDNVITPE